MNVPVAPQAGAISIDLAVPAKQQAVKDYFQYQDKPDERNI